MSLHIDHDDDRSRVFEPLPELEARAGRRDVALFKKGLENLGPVLHRLGFEGLREEQKLPVFTLLSGKDVLLILRTGGGKSLVFALPSLCVGWKTLVFSPLQALMQDQFREMTGMGVKAAQVSGMQSDSLNALALQEWMAGDLDMLYVAPERMDNEMFKHAMDCVPPEFVAVDEAHVISQWSDDFRHHYVKIGAFIEQYQPRVVGAFTATCRPRVEADIRRVLGLQQAKMFRTTTRRDNLHLSSKPFAGYRELAKAVKGIPGSCIVYCATVKEVEGCAAQLQAALPQDTIMIFHGKMQDAGKQTALRAFIEGSCRVIVATNAFGMGINKKDIRGVIHRDFPGTPEALSQEVGRAGRDGKDSWCICYISDGARNTQEFFIDSGNPPPSVYRAVFNVLARESKFGPLKMTQADIAEAAGVDSKYIMSVMEQLQGAGVIVSERQKETVAKVKIPPDYVDSEAGQYKAAMQILVNNTEEDEHGYRAFDLGWLASKCGVRESTLKSRIYQWRKDNLLTYDPPYRGNTTRVVGDISLVDMDRMKRKRALAFEGLSKVMEYLDLPDDEKSAWLEQYFEE